VAYDVNELMQKALDRASQTTGTFQPGEEGRKVGDKVAGVLVEYSEINHPEYGHSPGTVLRPLSDDMKVPDPANPDQKADLVNFLWLGEVLSAAYYRLLPEIGDIIVAQVTGQRESKNRKPQRGPSGKVEPVLYWDWNVVVYDPQTGAPKLPAAMRGIRLANPNTGEIRPAPGPGQESFPTFTEDDETMSPAVDDVKAGKGK
jgi:hypothetical protein